jgi:hypothetical protein
MNLLVWVIILMIIVGVIIAVLQYIPIPAPLAWLKWVIPLVALLIALILILQRTGMLT